jgi:hypothetical protein
MENYFAVEVLLVEDNNDDDANHTIWGLKK